MQICERHAHIFIVCFLYNNNVPLLSDMSMYACVVLLAVCVAAVSADSGYDYYRPPLPPCDDCVCRIEAKRQDARTNGIFVPWFNAVFRKDIFPCPPRIPKLPYYTQNYRPPTIRPCTCEEDKKLTVFFCKNQISKLQALPHQKVYND